MIQVCLDFGHRELEQMEARVNLPGSTEGLQLIILLNRQYVLRFATSYILLPFSMLRILRLKSVLQKKLQNITRLDCPEFKQNFFKFWAKKRLKNVTKNLKT